jgi:hypothetical protein
VSTSGFNIVLKKYFLSSVLKNIDPLRAVLSSKAAIVTLGYNLGTNPLSLVASKISTKIRRLNPENVPKNL